MRLFITALACLLSFSIIGQELNNEESKLYNLIMEYRASKGLPEIALSKSLTFVAQTHVKDLENNHPDIGNCNMHSWSNKGDWTPCCYTSDHARAQCMWGKPSELTSYKGNGYEIAYGSSGLLVTALGALNGWKKSHGHNQVIINQGIWHDNNWKAIGIGIYKGFAVVWFGEERDKNSSEISQTGTKSHSENSAVKKGVVKEKGRSVELKRVTRVLTIGAISDEIDFNSFVEDPQVGFEINYTKQKMSRVLSKGISFGYRPISTMEKSVILLDTTGVIKVRDQIIHGHITLRFSPLKFSKIQPYIDLIGGAQGSLLTSKFKGSIQENETSQERVYFKSTWTGGLSAGVRVMWGPHVFLDLRYARVFYGDLESIEDILIEDNGEVTYTTSDWEAPPGYLRLGVSFSY